MDIQKILKEHKMYIEDKGGKRADLSEADLSEADLREANLSWANLSWANLSEADLSEADLREADLREANLSWANLSEADLSEADLREANLSWANLSEADLSGANLSEADLSGANLSEANLRGADLCGADLSLSEGLLQQSLWMSESFDSDKKGIIVYKAIGNTTYNKPEHWEIKPNSILEEVCNPCRVSDCACGVNFATKEWIQKNYKDSAIWKCRIEWKDLPGVVVPYNADGKARCERLVLLSKED